MALKLHAPSPPSAAHALLVTFTLLPHVDGLQVTCRQPGEVLDVAVKGCSRVHTVLDRAVKDNLERSSSSFAF